VRRLETWDGNERAVFAGDLLPARESALIRSHGMQRIDVYLE
jgi:hypothetical protein